MLQKNDIVELTIDGITSDGSGVARADGIAVFIPFAIPGDRVKTRIVKVAKNCLYGIVEEIVMPSADRIAPDCNSFGKCGGCVYRNAEYSAELKYKREKIVAAMKRIGGLDIEVPEVIGCEPSDRYRNKLMLPVGRDANGESVCGLFAKRSHRIVSCSDCLLQPKEFMQIAHFAFESLMRMGVSAYDEKSGKGLLRHIYIRQAPESEELMLCLVLNGKGFGGEDNFSRSIAERFPQIKSIVINTNRSTGNIILGEECRTIYGSDHIFGSMRNVSMRISPLSFCQVNSRQCVRLYDIAEQFASLTAETLLLDIYCGAGVIGLSMANKVKELIGVEIVPPAIEDAKRNAKESGISNARFICADASEAAAKLLKEGKHPDVVILDPPRAGCDRALIETVVGMAPERVVYISCDVATQARDLKIFAELGYKTEKLQGVDMFPRTAHVETVALLSRK